MGIRSPIRRILGTTAIAVVLVGLSACSAVRLAYENLDWFAMRYINGYLDLTEEQEAELEPRLRHALEVHRREGMPEIVRLLAMAHTTTRDGLAREEVTALGEQALRVYEDLAGRIIPLLSPTLADLSPEQLDYLRDAVTERNEQFAERYGVGASRTERVALRAERMSENLVDWVGPLSEQQRLLIETLSAGYPDHVDTWEEYRTRKQERLFTLIETGASPKSIEAHLFRWWVKQDDMGDSSYLRAADARTRLENSLLAIDASLSEAQREHLLERLLGLRTDLAAVLPSGRSTT